jgi:cobalamin biosynthesis protein CobT
MKKKISLDILEENGFQYGKSPWDFLIEEAAQEVNSDDDTPPEDAPEDSGSGEEAPPEDGESQEEPLLSEEELQQLAQDLQQSEDMEADVKELLDSGKINQADVEILGQLLQGSQEPTPDEERAYQINNIQEMVIRFSIYDKLNDLEGKLEIFTDHFPNIDDEFYKDVAQIHEYIKVVNTLIFNLEINLVYQLFANLEMKLIQLFTEYQSKMQQEKKFKG